MRIALVSKTNGSIGGASFFAENLGSWFLEAEHEVTHFCIEPKRELRFYQRKLDATNLAAKVLRHLNWRARSAGLIEHFPWEFWFGLKARLQDFDVIHFHDLHMAISPRTLSAVAGSKPVVFTTHDTSAFTGGCLNPMGCGRFEETCGNCPQKKAMGWMDFTRHNLAQMRRLPAGNSVNYVFPSQWIQNAAHRSLNLSPSASTHIPNGFDPGPYRFKSRREARILLGIQPGKKVIAFSSSSVENKLKGTKFALAAIRSVKEFAPLAIVIGHAPEGLKSELPGLDCRLTGFIHDREKLALFYSAADLVLYPSLGDNLPVTIQEAMAAATPVLAFDVGGIPELIRSNETGWLTPVADQEALNLKLQKILHSTETGAIGNRAREFIADDFSVARCVDRHIELYQGLLPGSRTRTCPTPDCAVAAN